MKDEKSMSSIIKKYGIFVLLIMVQLGTIIWGFSTQKEGFHSDEIWSYGYANSYNQKDVYQDEKGQLISSNKWVDSKELRDYIVVNQGEQFQYKSIIENQKTDLSPPFHSILLHTICSLFPERFSRWFSFSINIVAFLLCMIYLYKLCCCLEDNCFALCVCAIYGFSWACRDTFVYLRMYALCVALLVMYLYHLVMYLQSEKKNPSQNMIIQKNLLSMVLLAFLSFMTHYYMIAVIGLLTFFVCGMLLFQRKIKRMFVYGISMLFSLASCISSYPSLIGVSKGQGSSVASATVSNANYTFAIRTRILINFLTQKLYNIHIEIYSRGILKIVVVCILVLLVWVSPLIYLFRDKKPVQKQLRKCKFIWHHKWMFTKYLVRRVNWLYPIMLIVMFLQIIVIGETSHVYYMGYHEDRYMTYLYPIATIFGVAVIYHLFWILCKKKKISQSLILVGMFLCIGMNLYNRLTTDKYYFKENIEEQALVECLQDTSVIFLTEDPWFLTAAVPYLMNANEFMMLRFEEYEYYTDIFKEKIAEGKPVVVLFDMSIYDLGENDLEDIGIHINKRGDNGEKSSLEIMLEKQYAHQIQYFEDLYEDNSMELLSKQNIFVRPMEAYLLNPNS